MSHTQGPAAQILGTSPLQTQMTGSSHSRNNSGESLADIYSRTAAAAGLGFSTGSLQASAQQPLPAQPIARVIFKLRMLPTLKIAKDQSPTPESLCRGCA